MEFFHGVILAVIQGLTEFLPVSSSGHLVIFQNFFDLKESMVSFDINVHFGTLLAVIVIFRKEIQDIIISLFSFLKSFIQGNHSLTRINQDPDAKLAFLIIIGSIPTGIIGLGFHNLVDRLFSSIILTGMMLIITGFLLWGTKNIKNNNKNIENFSIKGALLIGLIQGIAILPGISRSGSTIAAGIFLGLNRKTAAKYSFLLSVPAIAGAEILNLKSLYATPALPLEITLASIFISFIVGVCSLKLLLYFVKQGRLHYFSPYCWFAGATALFYGIMI